jgi:hypothetical protein
VRDRGTAAAQRPTLLGPRIGGARGSSIAVSGHARPQTRTHAKMSAA